MFWFDKDPQDVIFGDIRRENHVLCDGRTLTISPALQMDFTAMPFCSDVFDTVVFDPPHLVNVGKNAWMAKKYGRLQGEWEDMLRRGFSECFRVLRPGGSLVFKWNEIQIPTRKVVQLAQHQPLLGHKSGKASNTHWLYFVKQSVAGKDAQ